MAQDKKNIVKCRTEEQAGEQTEEQGNIPDLCYYNSSEGYGTLDSSFNYLTYYDHYLENPVYSIEPFVEGMNCNEEVTLSIDF